MLIHCHAGVSRSATILAAYLIHKKQITADEAVKIIQEKRKRAKPNDAFMKQLKEYECVQGKCENTFDVDTNTSTPKKE